MDVPVVGPVTDKVSFLERMEQWIWRRYKKVTGKGRLKFPLTTAFRASRMLDHAIQVNRPDIAFSIFPSFFIFKRDELPCVWYLDATFWGQQVEWPLYGQLPLKLSIWQEKRALSNLASVVVTSQWSKDILVNQYGVDGRYVDIVPIFPALPARAIPARINIESEKCLGIPLKLLLVGRVYERKGIDIAIEIVRGLNREGIPARLTVCGYDGKDVDDPFVQYAGPYRKSDPAQLENYVDWYKWANLLLHPARFEAAGIVPSEAAAFGTPTITNDTGGLATTVKHGESGIVLPRKSPPEAYVRAIRELIGQPERYYALCHSTRQRYDRELNSDMAGRHLVKILQDAVDGNSGREK